jgi:hypothetical protein
MTEGRGRDRRQLVPQPHGPERRSQVSTPLEAHNPPLPEGPGVSLLLDKFGPAPTDTGVKADGGHDGVPAVEQLMNLVTRRLEQFTAASQGLRDLNTAATNTGFDGLRRIDVFDVRGGELVDDPVRISVEQPVRIDPPHKLDVLLRHRRPSMARWADVMLAPRAYLPGPGRRDGTTRASGSQGRLTSS